MKLDEKERRLLSAVELDANRAVPELSRATGFRQHTVRYQLQKLSQAGLIKYKPIVNVESCGLKIFDVFFNLPDMVQLNRSEVIKRLAACGRVISVKEYVGDYDCSVSIAAAQAEELNEELEKLSSGLGVLFSSKTISTRVSTSLLNRAYLSEGTEEKEIKIPVQNICALEELDEIDIRILCEVTCSPEASLRRHAQKLSLPVSTVHFRLGKLEQKGLILGYRYAVDAAALGIHSYKLLLSAKRLSKSSRLKLRHFCKSNPHIVEYIHCVGCWDYECKVELEKQEQLAAFRQELHEHFEDDIAKIRYLSLLNNTGTSYASFFKSWEEESRDITERELAASSLRRAA